MGPAEPIAELAREAAKCRRRELWRDATRMVFGEGPEHTSMVLMGDMTAIVTIHPSWLPRERTRFVADLRVALDLAR